MTLESQPKRSTATPSHPKNDPPKPLESPFDRSIDSKSLTRPLRSSTAKERAIDLPKQQTQKRLEALEDKSPKLELIKEHSSSFQTSRTATRQKLEGSGGPSVKASPGKASEIKLNTD